MLKFDMGAAWDDTKVLLRSHSALTGTIAAVFLFLPTLAVGWFGPVPIEPADGATLEQVMAAVQESLRQSLPYQLLISVIAAIGGVGILRLWLSRTGTSVGDALAFAIRMIPTMIAIQLILGIGLALLVLVLIAPGIATAGSALGALLLFVGMIAFAVLCAYFWGRLAVAAAVVADGTVYNPVAAIQRAWQLTRGNGWRIFLFLFLIALVIVIVGLILTGVVGAVVGTGDGVGRMLSGVAEGAIAAVGGLVSVAIAAATYRQLATSPAAGVFD